MKDYTLAETFTLPSKGKIYDVNVPAQVRLRSMTTEEEQKRLAITDYPYRMLCEIIDDCIISDMPISTYDMAIGDYQFLLYKLRVVTYSSKYKMSSVCPYCGCTTKEEIDLDDLPLIEEYEQIDKYLRFELPVTKKVVKLNIQTPRGLDQITEEAKEFRKRGGTKDKTLTYTLRTLINEVDGKKEDPIHLEEWVSQLPLADVNMIISHAEKINSLLGVDTELILTCDVCGLSYKSALKTSQEFFRPALEL